ncbi:MAG: hypothetical protein ACP5SF_04270 [Thermoplasmata archaeon]
MKGSRNKLIAILVGILFMLIALLIQIFVQELPSIIMIMEYGISEAEKILTNFELSDIFLYALFIGGTAAFFQEIMKLFAVRFQEKEYAFWVGIGFSIIDISVIFIEILLSFRNLSFYEYAILLLNVASSLMFHPGTAMFLKHGLISKEVKIYFPIAFLLHLILDGGVVLSDIYVLKNPSSFAIVVSVYWSIAIFISIFVLLWGRILINEL